MESQDEVATSRIGSVVGGRWRLEALLGSGGMAAVYSARAADGSGAAIKILHPEMARRRDVRERFLREAYVANRVSHPGAVAVLEHGNDDAEAYLVMELLEGETLAALVKRSGGLDVGALFGILDQVLDVLASAHEQGIIHRDIKPDNLFVCRDGRVEVLDFGLARMVDEMPGEFKTRTGLALGTLPYMAPEQALGKRDALDGRADLFALGASAFRILAGRKVHEAESEAELLVAMATKAPPALRSVAPNVPPHAAAIIDLSLAFSKDARYPDARTMQADVRAFLQGKAPPYAVTQGVQTARDAPTRVDVVAPSLTMNDPTRAVVPPRATQPHTVAAVSAPTSPGGSQPPPSLGPPVSGAPHSFAPHSYAGPPSVGPAPSQTWSSAAVSPAPMSVSAAHTSTPPAKRGGGAALLLLLAGGAALLALGVVLAIAVFYGDPEAAAGAVVGNSPAATHGAASTAPADGELPPSAETSAGATNESPTETPPPAPAAGATGGAKTKASGGTTATARTAAAPSSATAAPPTTVSPSLVATPQTAAPQPTGAPTPPAPATGTAPAPGPTTTATGGDKGKGHGKDKNGKDKKDKNGR